MKFEQKKAKEFLQLIRDSNLEELVLEEMKAEAWKHPETAEEMHQLAKVGNMALGQLARAAEGE